MEKGVNSTEAAFETLQNQQKILIEDNFSVHKEITNIYKELHNTNLSIVNSINQTNKSIKDYIDPSENRSVETIKHLNQFILKTEDNIKTLFNNIKELDSRIEGVINSINLIRNILRHNENNQNQNDSDSESVLEVEE
jgi:predicted PurR-regulated permease PerM